VRHNPPHLTLVHDRRDDDHAPRQVDDVGPSGLEHPVHDRLHVVVPRKGFSGRDPDWRSEHLSVCLVYANEDVTRPAELREQNVAGHGAILPMAPRRRR
jgi:hypothetical protein